MWRCRHCGGEVFAEVEIHSSVEFNIDKHGDITEPSTGFTLDEIVRDDIEVLYYRCEDCGSETDTQDKVELEEIAEWVEE